MEQLISTEQGDNNSSDLRAQYNKQLDSETQHWINEDAKYFLHQALSTPVMNVLEKTQGPFIYDIAGNRYLDLHGNGVHNAGFSNPDIIQAAISQLQASLAFTPRRYTNIPAIRLAKKLTEIAPGDLDRVLFCPGGSEAIEMAVMLAKQITGKWKTISFWDSYHGTGFQAASVSGEEHFYSGNGPMVPGSFHVEFPNYYRNPWNFDSQDQADEAYLRQVKIILQRHPDMAAIIAEPISATPVIPSVHYWNELRTLCDKYGILLIFDEIIEGFGRTGKFFACEHFVIPDVLVLGKTLGGGLLPFAGIVTKGKYNTLSHRSIGHFTHEKNPLCSAVGLATIEYIENHKLVENAASLGDYLLDRLLELKDIFPLIGNVCGRGLHIGVEMVTDRTTKQKATRESEWLMYECLKEGLAFKIIEGNVVTMRPALTITKDDCDFIVDTLKKGLQRIPK